MSQATSPVPLRRRPRTWRRRVLLTLMFLVLLGAGGILYFLWSSCAALNEIVAEIDRHDPGWRLDEIEAKRKVVPDAQNSALHILAIGKLQGGQSVMITPMEKMFENLPPQVQLNEQQTVALDKRFDIFRKAVVEARKLKDTPDGRYPIQYSADGISAIEPCLQARGAAELLEWDAARRAHASDGDGALESCLALQHAARSVGDEPSRISQGVRCSINGTTVEALERTLAQGHFTLGSEPALKRMQAALARELLEPTFLVALRGERAMMHQFGQALAEGKVDTKDLEILGLMKRFPGYLTRQHAALLRYLNDMVEFSKLPLEEADEQFQALEKKSREQSIWVRNMVSVTEGLRMNWRHTQANLRCAVAAMAAERYRLVRNRWPESLDVLVKAGLLDAVPTDPYDGKPIRLKRTAEGLIVYSVGHDKIDNGGAVDRDRSFIEPGTDQGFRLWDVARRRQPPNPPVAEIEEP